MLSFALEQYPAVEYMSRELYDDVLSILDFWIIHQTNEGLNDIDACRNVVVV